MEIRKPDAQIAAHVRDIVMREKSMSLSEREWKHRLRGYGYAVRETQRGQIVTTLPHGVEICMLDIAETVH